MTYIVKKKIKGQIYLYQYDSIRVNGQHKNIYRGYLGREDKVELGSTVPTEKAQLALPLLGAKPKQLGSTQVATTTLIEPPLIVKFGSIEKDGRLADTKALVRLRSCLPSDYQIKGDVVAFPEVTAAIVRVRGEKRNRFFPLEFDANKLPITIPLTREYLDNAYKYQEEHSPFNAYQRHAEAVRTAIVRLQERLPLNEHYETTKESNKWNMAVVRVDEQEMKKYYRLCPL